MPRRPSGADKKQKPAKKEGRQGRSRNRRGADGAGHPTREPAIFAANRHCPTLKMRNPRPKPLTVRCKVPRAGPF
ncbi:hypothetical protein KXW36_001282 [Aspergillus fumigatus]|nr:hypothetical protein KXW36_001282 [Aspergillus fumigatus]